MVANILAITLARAGSKGVPNKNEKLLGSKPLISYTIESVLACKTELDYLVFTNSVAIQNIANSYDLLAPFLRSEKNASDTASSTDALIEAVHAYEEYTDIKYDYIVECMATSPFKTSEDIDCAIDLLIETKADSVIGVTQLSDFHPARAKKIVDGRIADFCVPELAFRRQDLRPEAYIRNGSIYALSREALMTKKLRFGGDNSVPYVMPTSRSINIDTQLDFLTAEQIILNPKILG